MASIFTEFKNVLKTFGIEYFKRYYSTYRGFVVDNKDPENLMRVKLRCPAVFGSETFDDWVYPKGVICGNNFGFYAVPSVGDLIWVSFEMGDPAKPIWEYGHWNQKAKTPGTDIQTYIFQTPNKQKLEFDDKKGVVRVTNKDGFTIEMSKDGFQLKAGDVDMKTLMDSLFTAFSNTKTATSLGPQPFINIAEYEALKLKFDKLFY